MIYAVGDPDPRVAGRGAAALRAAGIEVIEGVCRDEAAALHAGFFSRLQRGRPQVTLKSAVSLDGRIAAAPGVQTALSGREAQRYVQYLRAEHEGIAVGSGTACIDDPRLDCRLPGLEGRSPARLVLDRRARLPETSVLRRSAQRVPTHWLVDRIAPEAFAIAQAQGVQVHTGVRDLLDALSRVELNTLLIEAGGVLAASLLRERLIDRWIVITSPRVLGSAGVPVFDAAVSADFECVDSFVCGVDRVGVYQCC